MNGFEFRWNIGFKACGFWWDIGFKAAVSGGI